MYCRKCGTKLEKGQTRCPKCGTEVLLIAQRSYDEKYREAKQKEKSAVRQIKVKPENRYMNYAIICAFTAFVLSVLPWPVSWKIGNSIWMKVIILLVALIADYHCVKANQIDNMNVKKYMTYQKPGILKVANVLAILTTIVATFSLFMGNVYR
jgi:Oxygen-sensitive ribonucleoside-triphosphate reductase